MAQVDKHPGGRPTKLTDEVIRIAYEYLQTSKQDESPLPTIEALALELSVHRDTLQEWEKNNQDFSVILETLRQIQANKLIQFGLLNKYNSTIAKMMLTKHGYIEKNQLEHSGEINRNATDEELDAIIERANASKASSNS